MGAGKGGHPCNPGQQHLLVSPHVNVPALTTSIAALLLPSALASRSLKASSTPCKMLTRQPVDWHRMWSYKSRGPSLHLSEYVCMQGDLCDSCSHHASLSFHHAVSLPRHCAVHAVPIWERETGGSEFGYVQRAGTPTLAGSPTQGDCADACLHGRPELCHPPLCQVILSGH